MKIKSLVATLVLALTATGLHAQENKKDYHPYPYGFISLQGGGQTTFTNHPAKKLITPVGAFSAGAFITPSVGVRFHANGWKNKGYLPAYNQGYNYNYATGNLDLMLNLTNMFCRKHESHFLNVILLGGFGLSYAWDNDDLNTFKQSSNAHMPLAWEDDRLVHNFRAGLMLEGNVSKHLGVNLEVSANNLHDRFNSKQNGRGDWQLTAMVGLTYKFGFKKRKVEAPVVVVPEPVMETPVAPAPAPVVEEVVEEPKVEVVEEPAPAVVEEPAPAPAPEELAENIYFNINSAEITAEEEAKVKALSQWLESHPSAVVEVTGYADAGTGNADINMKISKKRAAAVAAQLSKKYGIPANRIKVSAKGDTIQPLTVNDKNRVVITYAKEQK